jgi:hypothetical protein
LRQPEALPLLVAKRDTAVKIAFIKYLIESGDILDFAADSLSQQRVTGRPIHRHVSGLAIRRLVNKQSHLDNQP